MRAVLLPEHRSRGHEQNHLAGELCMCGREGGLCALRHPASDGHNLMRTVSDATYVSTIDRSATKRSRAVAIHVAKEERL